MAVDGEGLGRRAVPFRALDPHMRKAVERAAARGELHPDQMVATSSVEWAQSRLTRQKGLRAVGGLALGAVISVVAFADLPDGDGVVGLWRERRLSKRIVKAAERTGFQAPAWALVPEAQGPKIPVADLVTKAGFAAESSERRRRPRHGSQTFRRR